MFTLEQDAGHCTATLQGLPSLVADARTPAAARRMAARAVALLPPVDAPSPSALPPEVGAAPFLRAMASLGWEVDAVHGSARRLVRAGAPPIVAAFHATLGRRTVALVLRQAGVGEAAFLAALPRTGTA